MKKRMAGENAEDAGVTGVEEVRRCMFEALDRYKTEAKKDLTEFSQLLSVESVVVNYSAE